MFLKKVRPSLLAWLAGIALLLFISFAAAYSAPNLRECFCRNIDPDFFLSIAALRWLDNLPTFMIIDPGYTHIQLLGWFYFGATKIGVLEAASFANLAESADPLIQLTQYVRVGWRFNAFLISLIAFTMFAFAKHLTGSNIVAFGAAVLVIASRSSVTFLTSFRPEPVSALLGIASLLFAFKALHATTLRAFTIWGILSSILLMGGVLAKLNVYPMLLVVPTASLLKLDTPMDELTAQESRSALGRSVLMNAWLAPFSLLLMKDYLASFSSARISIIFVTLLLAYLFGVALVRVRLQNKLIRLGSSVQRAVYQAALCVTGFIFGFQITFGLSLIHPKPNLFVLAIFLASLTGSILTALVTIDTRAIRAWRRGLRSAKLYWLIVGIVLIMATLLVSYSDVFANLPQRIRAQVSGAQPLGDLSYAIYLAANLDHGMQFVGAGLDIEPLEIAATVLGIVSRYYLRLRLPELILISLTMVVLLAIGDHRKIPTLGFIILTGVGLHLVSTIRSLQPLGYYVIYDDLYTVLAVAMCIRMIADALRNRLAARFRWRNRSAYAIGGMLVIFALLASVVRTRLVSAQELQCNMACSVVDIDVGNYLRADGPYWCGTGPCAGHP